MRVRITYKYIHSSEYKNLLLVDFSIIRNLIITQAARTAYVHVNFSSFVFYECRLTHEN